MYFIKISALYKKIYKPSIYNYMCLLNFSEAGRMSFIIV